MSKPRYDWWSYMKAVIRRYPERVKQYQELHTPSLSAPLAGAPGSKHRTADPTAQTAVKELPPWQQRELEAVQKAVEQTLRTPNGRHKLRLVSLVFWERRYSLQGAALALHCSYETAKRWQRQFIYAVAMNFFGSLD